MGFQIRVATICMTSKADMEANLKRAKELVKAAAADGAQWVLLPEIFAYNGPYDRFEELAVYDGSSVLEELCRWAAELKVYLFAGSLGELSEEDLPIEIKQSRKGYNRVYNTLYVIGTGGEIMGKYRKTHLFNLLNSDGTVAYSEADGFIPGDRGAVISIDGVRVGLSICYDLRFSGYFNLLQSGGPCDVFMVPSAFTKKTGEAHWELLLRARAVEYQAYVIASNQVGIHAPGKETYGHSMVVDPWGVVVANTGAEEGFVVTDISSARLQQVRQELPVLANRRPEIYGDQSCDSY